MVIDIYLRRVVMADMDDGDGHILKAGDAYTCKYPSFAVFTSTYFSISHLAMVGLLFMCIRLTPHTLPTGISAIVPFVSHVDHTEHDIFIFCTEQGLAGIYRYTHAQWRPM